MAAAAASATVDAKAKASATVAAPGQVQVREFSIALIHKRGSIVYACSLCTSMPCLHHVCSKHVQRIEHTIECTNGHKSSIATTILVLDHIMLADPRLPDMILRVLDTQMKCSECGADFDEVIETRSGCALTSTHDAFTDLARPVTAKFTTAVVPCKAHSHQT